MKKQKWLKLFLFVWIMGATLNVNAQEQVQWVELTDESRYKSEYNMPIPALSNDEQLDKAGISDTQLLELEEVLVEAWKKNAESVDVSAYGLPASNEACATYYFQILNSHPEIFHVSNSVAYVASQDKIEKINMIYTMEPSEAEATRKQMDIVVEEALSYISDEMEDYEKALVIHDWLVNYCKYDYDNLSKGTLPHSCYNADGALVDGVAVCDGYTKAYQYIMNNKLGIPCYRITSEAMKHAWNLIEIGNEYYHIDTTWDDPGFGTTKEENKIGYVGHSNFLLSDEGIANTNHRGWDMTIAATSTIFDAYGKWKDVESQIIYYKDKWYYADHSTRAIVSTGDILDGDTTTLYEFPTWKANTLGSYWPGVYSYPQIHNDKLIFNGPKIIYRMSFDTHEVKEWYVPKLPEDSTSVAYNIYGFDVKNDKLRYLTSSTPNLQGTETIHEVDMPTLGTIEGSASITGIVQYGNTLCVNVSLTSEISNELKYQWYRNGERIEAANGESYTLQKSDIGTKISVKVTAQDYSGELTAETEPVGKIVASAPTEPVGVSAFRGQTLGEIPLPSGYSWEDSSVTLDVNGTKEYGIIYCPDEEIYHPVLGLKATVNTTCKTHDWDDGSVIKEATETKEGLKLYQCLFCSDTYTEVLQKKESNPTPNPDPNPNTKGEQGEYEDKIEVGFTFTDEKTGNKYKITKITDEKVEATFTGNESKKKKSITIPATVEYEDITIKVACIGKKALSNNKSLKSVVIGKNVTSIEQNAFSGCKKLKTITIKSTKLKTFGKNCIKNIHKKAIIKCPKSCKNKYKKGFSKKTGFTKQMKIK